jgi:putative ABC transport system permease protein
MAAAVFRWLAPIAERDEVLADLQAEYEARKGRHGSRAARRWVWQQALRSVPALVRRTWWRGMNGFESGANSMRPGGPMLEMWIIDFRYAARRLRSRPTYAALAVLTIALGAGGTAAIFSVVRALLLDPLPIAHEEQVGVLWFQLSWREEEFLGLRPDFPGFQRMAAYRPGGPTLEAPDGSIRQISGYAVSAELFDVLGTPAMLGRTFKPGEDLVGAERVVVLGHPLWQELGADPNIIGKPLLLGGVPHTVVGVMPRGFWFPSPTTRMWTAAQMNPQNKSGQYSLIGRLAEGHSFDSMQGSLQILASKLAQNFQYSDPVWARPRNPSITPAREFFVGDVRPSLLATLAAMGVILLIGCANVTALILGQVDARAPEIAVRAALGANRQRVIQQLVIESLLIGVLAGGCGAALAAVGFEALVGSLPLDALAENVRLDWTVFWVSMLASLAASVLVSIIPGIALWRGSRLQSTMSTIRTGGVGARGGRLEGALVVAQITLAVLLVTGAGLLVRSAANLRSIDSGLKVNEVAVVDAVLPRQRIAPGERQRAINATLMSLKALPGVTAVAAAQKLPLRDRGDNWGISIQGRPNPNATTAFRMVTPDYFTAMGIPIRRGRNFGPDDHEGTEPVVIINEALAQKFFPGEDPIGHVLRTLDTGERIIGVAGNTHETGLTDAPVPARYMLYDHIDSVPASLSFVIRTGDKDRIGTVLAAARSAIAREKGRVVATETATMKDIFEEAMGPTGRVVTLLSLLGGLALFLGAVGVYGVSWHYVVRRSRDYSIRIALGEPPSRVFWQVAGRSAILVAAGSVIGVASAFAVTRLLSSLLYGVGPTDPLALSAAVFILLLTGLAAAFIPARRASLLDPATLLREN